MGLPLWECALRATTHVLGPGAGPLCQAAEQHKQAKERYARYAEHRAERSHRDKADQRQQYGNRKGSLASVTRCLREQSANGCAEQQHKSHESSDPQFEVDIHPEILDVPRQVVEIVVTEPVIDAVFEVAVAQEFLSGSRVLQVPVVDIEQCLGLRVHVVFAPVGKFQYQW